MAPGNLEIECSVPCVVIRLASMTVPMDLLTLPLDVPMECHV